MRKEDRIMAVIVIAVIAIIISSGLIIKTTSGVDPPFTVIESESMQHSMKSQIGVIDTADMMLVISPEKTAIKTYVDGYHENYETFGDFGSVIIYKRMNHNPVIHRAILWLEWDETTLKWKAPSLAYFDSELWNNGANDDYNSLSGTLTISFKSEYRDRNISIDLDYLNKHSGYLTLGDHNGYFDQAVDISQKNLITEEQIKSVAWKEIPWIGAIKLISKGGMEKIKQVVPNTIPNLLTVAITIFITIGSLGYIADSFVLIRIKKRIM